MPANVSISFPHLGIEISNLKQTFSLFGIDVAFYGLIIGLGMLAAMALAFRDAKETGQNVDDYIDLALYGIIFAIVGARLYYILFEWDYYREHITEIFNLRKGGLAIYGGIIGGVTVCLVLAKKKGLSFWKMLDTGAIGLVTGQMIGRWGNFFNREAYGSDTDSLFAMRINLQDPNVSVIVQENVTVYDGNYIQVHPTFLYESFWCLCILTGIQLFKRKKAFDGEVFLWYITAYGFGRFFIEGLRTDQLRIFHTNLAVSQVLSGVLFIVGIILIVYNHIQKKRGGQPFWVGAFVCHNSIQSAKHFAENAHRGQEWTLQDGSKISYYKGHLLGVYGVLAEFEGADQEVLVTALLHDTMEDTDVTLQKIENCFGRQIADNVKWLSKGQEDSYEAYIDRLLKNGSDATILVKLADRLYNTRNLMNLGDSLWHEKKIEQAKYILSRFGERRLKEGYEEIKAELLLRIDCDVKELEQLEQNRQYDK